MDPGRHTPGLHHERPASEKGSAMFKCVLTLKSLNLCQIRRNERLTPVDHLSIVARSINYNRYTYVFSGPFPRVWDRTNGRQRIRLATQDCM